jgi:transcriptional regulator with XRE-family HTH domain
MLGTNPKSNSYSDHLKQILNRLPSTPSGFRLRFVNENLKSIIGVRVKAARKANNLTQSALAEAVNRTVEAISNIERGKSLPPLDLLERIGEELNCTAAALIDVPAQGGPGAERARLETELMMAGRALPIEQLRIAVAQIGVLQASGR